MRRSTSVCSIWAGKHERSGPVIFTSLLVISIIIAIVSQGFAQETRNNPVRIRGEALTRQRQNEQTPLTRRVFVRSKSLLVRAAVVEDKLLKRPEFRQLGFVLTRDESDADIILELRHDLFTKYVFSVVEVRSQLVLASGKLSSLGGTVGGKVAKRFVKAMAQTPGP
jgi:hypothetical protein